MFIYFTDGGEFRLPLPRDTTVDFDTGAYQELRNYLRQFGLGARTRIEYPYESTGCVRPSSTNTGLLMDSAISQYESILRCN